MFSVSVKQNLNALLAKNIIRQRSSCCDTYPALITKIKYILVFHVQLNSNQEQLLFTTKINESTLKIMP